MISTKGRYALRVIIDLAQQDPNTFIPLVVIAERQEISFKYLEIVIKVLVKEGLLEGHRGKGGGYKLTRKPSEYTVGEILELAEGNLAPVACLANNAEVCPRKEHCITLPLWTKYNQITRDFFFSITVQDIINGCNFEQFELMKVPHCTEGTTL